MAIRNNTTSLGMGAPRITAREFQDTTASQISLAVARANYRKSFRSDARVAELRQYVYKMVSSFSKEDKMAILAEYGDISGAKRDLDAAVTEALIVRLKEEDLQVLLRDIKSDEISLNRKVKNIRQNQKRLASKFSTRTFEDVYNLAKDYRNPKNLKKAIKEYDKSFKVPRTVVNQFPRLKKELRDVLKEVYDRVTLPGLAARMGIEFEDGITQKELTTMIVNKTLLYVSLVLGKSKMTYSSAIIDPAPYQELLKYTTYGYLAGSAAAGTVGMGPDSLRQLRQDAINAKRMARERFTRRSPVSKARGISKFLSAGVLGGAALAFGTGGIGPTALGLLGLGAAGIRGAGALMSGELGNEARLQRRAKASAAAIKSDDPEYERLARMSPADLLQEGVNLGLPPQRISDTPESKDKYIRKILAIKKRDELRAEQLDRRAANRARRGAFLGFGRKTLSAREEAERQALKGKKMGSEGSSLPYIMFKEDGTVAQQANYAVKVFVVNQGTGMLQPKTNTANSTGGGRSLLGVLSRNAGREVDGERNYAYLYSLAKDSLPEHKIRLGADGSVEAVFVGGSYLKKNDLLNYIDGSVDIDVDNYGGPGGAIKASTMLSDSVLKKGIDSIKKEPATPVFITNKAVPTDTGALLKVVIQTLVPALLPFASPLVQNAIETAMGGSGIESLISMAGLATGGTGRAFGRSSKTTHFISGDSLSTKPNPEQVSINWSKKSYTVKPIPQETMPKFAEGGSRSASGQITRMTEYDRQAPMKVYAVNPGITDLVDVGNAKVSMIGLVADMAGRLLSIENLLSIGNQQNAAVVAATSATASNINKLASKSGSASMNPFAGGFPSDLDSILTGR